MKRDFELIRKILVEAESVETLDFISDLKIEGYDRRLIDGHISILMDAKMLEAVVGPNWEGISSSIIYRLTWAGHDFLDAMRDDSIWSKAKESVLMPAGGVAFDVLLRWLKWKMEEQLGIPPN